MSVATSIPYVMKPQTGHKLSAIPKEVAGAVGATRRAAVVHDPRPVQIQDVRACETKPSLSKAGFELVKLKDLPNISWTTPEQIEEKYHPYLQRLVAAHTGASRVEILDQRLRFGSESSDKVGAYTPKTSERPPAATCHVDYTSTSAPNRVRRTFPEEAERLLQKPYAMIQIWQPLERPVEALPFALMDGSSVQPPDLLTMEMLHFNDHKPHEFYVVAHNEDHRWFYTKGMRPDEAYMFVGYDSREDGRPRCVPHTAFKDPNTSADAPPRRSIEFRTVAFWDN